MFTREIKRTYGTQGTRLGTSFDICGIILSFDVGSSVTLMLQKVNKDKKLFSIPIEVARSCPHIIF